MKYFTPELLERVASSNDDIADAADMEWERAIARSRRRWQKIKGAFPEAVRRFEEQSVCLHDARVLSMARKGETLVIILQLESPSTDIVLLIFTLEEEPVIKPNSVRGHGHGDVVNWLYEEWDLDRRGNPCFEFLLSNAWSIRLRFRDFQFLVLAQIWPAPDGQAIADVKTIKISL